MEQRRRNSLDIDWRFIRADLAGADRPDFDDSGWQLVSLPHTFNDVDTFDNFMEHGHNGERSMFTGRTWYRKRFAVPAEERGNRFLLEFEGARQAAHVFVNGVRLAGTSENGFVPFGYDVTDHVRAGEENVLAVMVDNTFPYHAEGSGDVLSWHDSHWHPTHGGLWRTVHLHSKPAIHLTLPLHSFLQTQGTYVWSTVSGEDAALTVEAEVANTTGADADATVHVLVRDADGAEVLSAATGVRLAAGATTVATLDGNIAGVVPWSPDHPHLYTVTARLEAAGSHDELVVEHGVRHATFTADQGFFLNGHHLKLVGWGQRPTNEWAGLGAAFPDWMHGHIAQLMRDAGANMVRWGHSAGAPADIAAADHLGLVTVQPGVDGEGSTVGGVYSEASYAIRLAAWRDTVIRYRNNPSILVWEAGNQSVPRAEAEALRAVVELWDPHGGRAFAARRSDSVMAEFVDLSIGTEGSWELRSFGKPILEGEYNREEAARRVWDRSTPGYEDYHTAPGSAYDLTSEDLAVNQARHFRKIADRAHSGGVNWIFSDSTSHGRVYSEVTRAGGAVDAVMLPKEAYWSTAVIFDPRPRAHLVGHWTYPAGTTKDVHVMARAASVELLLNGRSLGVVDDPSDEYLFTFPGLAFEPGELRAVARDASGAVVAQDARATTGAAVSLRLTPFVRPGGAVASGADVIHLDVEALDAEGRRVPTAEHRVSFDHDGPVTWRGGYNSGREGSTNESFLDLEAGVNRVALRTRRQAGVVAVRATAEGLTPAEVTVQVAAVDAPGGLAEPQALALTGALSGSAGFGPGPDADYVAPVDDSADSTIFGDLSYSGAGEFGGARAELRIGDPVYSDEPVEFGIDHPVIFGADYLLLPNADRDYKALDLIHVTLRRAADVHVAHDDRLPRPEWLLADFADTGITVGAGGHARTVFVRRCAAGQTLTLGGNTDEAGAVEGSQYLLFAQPVVPGGARVA